MVCRVSCAGCSFLITVGAQVIVVADQTFVTSSSKVAFKTRIAAYTFMATHYFSLRGRVYTHNCDKRTHTLPQCTENMGTLCCFFFFFSAPTTLCSMFLLLFLLLVLFTMVSPKRWLFSALNLSPAVHCLARSIFLTMRRFSHPCEILTRIFTTIFDTRCGLCLYFLGTLLTKSENEQTNEREKRITALLLSHTHITLGNDGNHIIAFAKIFFPFVSNDSPRILDQENCIRT